MVITTRPVVSAARKLIFLVPATDRIVAFPAGATVSEWGKGNDAPAIVVHNATDTKDDPNGTWQGAKPGHYVILNEVDEDAAEGALQWLREDFAVEDLESVLTVLANKGFTDQYTTDQAFVDGKLTPAGLMVGKSGIVKRDDRDVMEAYRDADGAIYVRHGDGDPKRVEDDIFARTYRNADGSPIDLASF